MKWLQLGVVVAALLGALSLALPGPVRAQETTEMVTIPVDGMT